MEEKIIKCEGCGKEFISLHGNQRYCTKKCYSKFYMRKYIRKHSPKKHTFGSRLCEKCLMCYTAKHKNQKYSLHSSVPKRVKTPMAYIAHLNL